MDERDYKAMNEDTTPMEELLEWVRKTLPMDLVLPQMMESKIKLLLKKEEDPISSTKGWVSVKDLLPKAFQTVWLSNGKGWCCLGCLIEDNEGWHWAESNGVIYVENGEIVSECESEDLDVTYWHELPKHNFKQ